MTKLAIALLLVFCSKGVYAFGLFPRHHNHGVAYSVPGRSSTVPDLSNSIPPVPEPQTYLYTLVGGVFSPGSSITRESSERGFESVNPPSYCTIPIASFVSRMRRR